MERKHKSATSAIWDEAHISQPIALTANYSSTEDNSASSITTSATFVEKDQYQLSYYHYERI